MTARSPRRSALALRWTCHFVVLGWTAALLARASWLMPLATAAEEPVTARVLPVPTPPEEAPRNEPAPEPEPAAEPAPAAEPEPVAESKRSVEPDPRAVSDSDFAAGSSLLDGAGRFPVLSFSYEDFSSFLEYARAMNALGARFVVVRNREIVGAVELESRAVSTDPLGSGFSPRARDYSGEPGLSPLSRAAHERFGRSAVVMMLVPRSLDAGLFGGLARLLSERGEPHAGLSEIRGRYEQAPGGGVRLRVEQVLRRDGTPVAVHAVFDLAPMAAGVAS